MGNPGMDVKSMDMESQAIVNLLMWVLGRGLQPSGGTVWPFLYWVISPVPPSHFRSEWDHRRSGFYSWEVVQ